MVNKFSENRVFVACGMFSFLSIDLSSSKIADLILFSDAAHVHSPAGGQGLNSSVQDVVSLFQVSYSYVD